VKPIRIMHVVRTMDTGGMENVVRKILSALDSNRFQQTVCTIVTNSEPCSFDVLSLGRDPNRGAFLMPELTRIFARVRPDIVHSRNWSAIEAIPAAKLARVPAVVHSEHGRDLQTMGRQPWRRRALRRLCFSMADHVFCVSRELNDYYGRALGLSPDSLDVIPNGVDLEWFGPDPEVRREMRQKLGVGPDVLVVGTVGRLDPVKGHSTLLRAAELALRSGLTAHFVIVGDGPLRATLENQLASSSELARCTHLVGHARNVAEWLNSFDVFVLPSLSEGLSNCLLEAMAVGLAPVATNVGGNCEVVVNEESGLLVSPEDPEAICKCLVRLAQAPDWRRQLGFNARSRVEARFSLQRMLARYEQMYSRLAERTKAGWPVVSRA
jgi:sugar transferase (PEP-CTERM/EpsH1 system associated)